MRASVYPTSETRRSEARDEYQMGLAFYQKKQWKTAARHFGQAEQRAGHDDVHMHLYMSYQGLCQVLSGDISGLNLCRYAASMETLQATVLQNLAIAELKLRHRKRACSAIRLGLRLDSKHAGLIKLRTRIGVRRKPYLQFLSRDNLLNKWLGRITHQRLSTAH